MIIIIEFIQRHNVLKTQRRWIKSINTCTFSNDLRVQLSSSVHFYLLYLLLNICDENDAF